MVQSSELPFAIPPRALVYFAENASHRLSDEVFHIESLHCRLRLHHANHIIDWHLYLNACIFRRYHWLGSHTSHLDYVQYAIDNSYHK